MTKASDELSEAVGLIESVRGKPQDMNTRRDKAIKLAALILQEARRIQTPKEKNQQAQLARMMNDLQGKAFTTSVTDQCFRTTVSSRVADQLVYLITQYGIPQYLSSWRRFELRLFKLFSRLIPGLLVPITKHMIRKETASVILPGEQSRLAAYLLERRREGVRVNLNHLGEAILGEEESLNRLRVYLDDLANPSVEYISVKISTIYSQISLIGFEDTLQILSSRLSQLYSAAARHSYEKLDGTRVPKFVNLDMEEFRDLDLTVEVFIRVLDQPEFFRHSAGIVLQAYVPNSAKLQHVLTEWAMDRVKRGGAPIKIRIVKGANLAMEQVDAALHGWPQAPYDNKNEVDANFKNMMLYGFLPEHAKAVHIGIASHNLFDIAFALLLRSENILEKEVSFEMLEGMADHMRRVIQRLSQNMLLYCPAAKREEFQNAVAYLIRRLDENTAPQNFLRYAFELEPGSSEWRQQVGLFAEACAVSDSVSEEPRRQQNRLKPPTALDPHVPFQNEPDTDWSLRANREWIHQVIMQWKQRSIDTVPIVIAGQELILPSPQGKAYDPNVPEDVLYHYCMALPPHVDRALQCAKETESWWATTSSQERCQLLSIIAQELRLHRSELMGAMIISCGKTAYEADFEIAEAIDFAEYYCREYSELIRLQTVCWRPKGTVVVAPPWNFPLSIPAGGILAALVTGNCVIFKPAREAVLVGWILANICWKAGISKKVLQFISCGDSSVGSKLIKDSRVDTVILTGATETARLFLQMRPGLDLVAETGGKNSIIVTSMADRDLAVRDIVQSAFGHAGQKCSACSLLILEPEVYDSPAFRQQLRDAAMSWRTGPSWNLSTRLNPLIHSPNPALLRGLTTLEPGEEWLVEPLQDNHNRNLWSPGIKLGVTVDSFTFNTELFGPVLGVMRANGLEDAVEMANRSIYGLTAGLHSLDEREQRYWADHIEAGNLYINRGITGAVVQRQPFGGCKDSSFGRGAKAGGSNYLIQLMHVEQVMVPKNWDTIGDHVAVLDRFVHDRGMIDAHKELWQKSIGGYAYYWNKYFSRRYDPSKLVGQDNFCFYRPISIILRKQEGDSQLDIWRSCAAALTCGAAIELSGEREHLIRLFGSPQFPSIPLIKIVVEDEEQLIARMQQLPYPRIRLLRGASNRLRQALAEMGARVLTVPVLAKGRLELLNYLREVALSIDYHRYGNLGIREGEVRTPLVKSLDDTTGDL